MLLYRQIETGNGRTISVCNSKTVTTEQLPKPEEAGILLLHLFHNTGSVINEGAAVPGLTLDLLSLRYIYSIARYSQLMVDDSEGKWVVSGNTPVKSNQQTPHTPVIFSSYFHKPNLRNPDAEISQLITVSPDSNAGNADIKPDRGIVFAMDTEGQVGRMYYFKVPRSPGEAKSMSGQRSLFWINDFDAVRSTLNFDPTRYTSMINPKNLPAIMLWRRESLDETMYTLTAWFGLSMPFGPFLDTLRNNFGGKPLSGT